MREAPRSQASFHSLALFGLLGAALPLGGCQRPSATVNGRDPIAGEWTYRRSDQPTYVAMPARFEKGKSKILHVVTKSSISFRIWDHGTYRFKGDELLLPTSRIEVDMPDIGSPQLQGMAETIMEREFERPENQIQGKIILKVISRDKFTLTHTTVAGQKRVRIFTRRSARATS